MHVPLTIRVRVNLSSETSKFMIRSVICAVEGGGEGKEEGDAPSPIKDLPLTTLLMRAIVTTMRSTSLDSHPNFVMRSPNR
jgi:hypothetical protein